MKTAFNTTPSGRPTNALVWMWARPSIEDAITVLHGESLKRTNQHIDSEQYDCFINANELGGRFAEAHGMLNDMEARLGFDSEAIDYARTALGSIVGQWFDAFPSLIVQHTGGGATCAELILTDGRIVMLTSNDDAALPTDSDEIIAVGCYQPDADGCINEPEWYDNIKLENVMSFLQGLQTIADTKRIVAICDPMQGG